MSKQSRSTTYRAAKKCVLMCEKELSTSGATLSRDNNSEYARTSPEAGCAESFSDQDWHDCCDSFEQGFSDAEDLLQTSDESEADDQETEENVEVAGNLHSALANWAVVYGVSHAALLALLTLLSVFANLDLPKDPRTLLQTPPSCAVKTMSGGEYFYFGLAASIKGTLKRMHKVPAVQTLRLQFNIDGIPLFKSARTALWPILCRIKNVSSTVFTVAIFAGDSKPTLQPYLADFLSELMDVLKEGLAFQQHIFKVEVDCFLCDAPARAFLKSVKGHSGYHGCERCHQKGVYMSGRLTFPDLHAPLRTWSQFRDMENDEHHHDSSPLLALGFDLVSGFPLDYMHLACLGVMRYMLRLWLCGPLRTRLPARVIEAISGRLCSVRQFLPREFARRPRSLYEFRLWKATELRQFLVYTGSYALKGLVAPEMYELFLSFSCAMTILLSQSLAHRHCHYARELLVTFVSNFAHCFGSQFLVYNVHGLIHLADDAEKYGNLDNISCFPFENHLQKLKKSVRRPQNPVAQIVRRVQESLTVSSAPPVPAKKGVLKMKHVTGPIPSGVRHVTSQYRQYVGPLFFSIGKGDNCILLNGTRVALIKNFLATSTDTHVVVQFFLSCEPFFQHPLDSSRLGSFLVSDMSPDMVTISEQTLLSARKCVLMPYDEKHTYAVVPLLHVNIES